MRTATIALILLLVAPVCVAQNYVTQYNGSGYVNCGSSISSSVSSAGKVTVEAKIRMTTTPGSWDSPCGTYYSDSWLDGGFGLYYNGSTQNMNFYVFSYTANNATAALANNNTLWHHLAGTWDQTTGEMKIYLDGVLAGTDNYTGTIGPITAKQFQIGAANSSYNWRGQLDEVRVWTIVRTQAEIQAAMNTQLTGSESGLIAYYKMEEGTGTSLTDNSGHGNTGTMTAGVTWIGAPTITSFSPASGTAGTTVTINGSIFTGASAVSFGGVPATSVTVVSDAQITAVVGAGATGDVVVTAPGGTATRSGFTWSAGLPADPTSVSVSVNPVCAGFPTQLTANGALGTVYWYSGSCGGTLVTTGNPITVSPSSTTTYYARNYDGSAFSAGCASATVTVSPPSFTPTAYTVSSLQATGTGLQWYSASTGGTLYTGSELLVNGQHYYASQTVGGVESLTRLDVVASVDPSPCKPTGNASQSFSIGATVASLQVLTGQNIRWYSASTGGTALAPSTVLVNGNHYYATQTVDCTESASRLDVVVTIILD